METIIETDYYIMKKWKWFKNKEYLLKSKCGNAWITNEDFNKLKKYMQNIHNLKWFTDRIWKTIYRDKWTCKCETCTDVYENWMIIINKSHASYLHVIEHDFASEWAILNYRDNK
jgi:hypothetical protein